jgi:hypothetical protein
LRLGFFELSLQVVLGHGDSIRHSSGSRRHGRSHTASSGAVSLILDLSEVLAACWPVTWERHRAGGFGHATLGSHGFGSSRGGERLAADTVEPGRGRGSIVGWQEKDPNLLLLDR